MSELTAKTSNSRIVLLDVYRVVAAMAVVMFHLVYRGTLNPIPCDVGFDAFGELFKYGYLGVDFFFIISGFVISFSAAHGDAWKFAYSRFLRLFPAFVLCCLTTYSVIVLFDDGRHAIGFGDFLLNFTMISGLFRIPYVDPAYWSLVVEIQFYTMVAILLCLRGGKHLENCIRVWLAISIFLYLVPIRGVNRLSLSEFAPLFAAGATFYFCYAHKITFARVLTLLFAFFGTLAWSLHKSEELTNFYSQDFQPTFIILAETLFFLAFILVLVRMEPRWPRFWIMMGTATYPLYLIHQNIGFIALNRLNPYLNSYANLTVVLAAVFGLTFVMSLQLEPFFRGKLRSGVDTMILKLSLLRSTKLAKPIPLRHPK